MSRRIFEVVLIAGMSIIGSCKTSKNVYQNTVFVVNGNDTLIVPQLGKYSLVNNISPRYQWNSNGGYCGEVSMISAGMYFGQFISQYDARDIASDNAPQNKLSSQLLLGQNDTLAAGKLRLKYEEWDYDKRDHNAFLAWVKMHVLQHHPVIIGVYTNEYLFYGDSNPSAGDPEYDHIVPVVGFGSARDFKSDSNKYLPADTILFSDNGLFTPDSTDVPDSSVHYFFNYSLKNFLTTREGANNPNGNPYSLAGGKRVRNYGIAITGVQDKFHETLPISLNTSLNNEAPAIDTDGTTRPKPIPLKISITVSKLRAGVEYNLYYYKDEKEVPTENFNKNSKKALWKTFKITTGTTFTTEISIYSDNKVFFRAVPASAE